MGFYYMEKWKRIKGLEDRFMVSSEGRIKSISRFNGKYTVRERIMRDRTTRFGYKAINLFDGEKIRYYQVHRLVAEAFIPNPDNKPVIDHLDGDKTNNCVSNLEWVSMAENNQRAYDKGLKRRHHAGQFIKGSNKERWL